MPWSNCSRAPKGILYTHPGYKLRSFVLEKAQFVATGIMYTEYKAERSFFGDVVI